MKTVFMFLVAMLAIETTSAQGQDACSKSYVSCMDKCVSRPSESLQANCIEACQSQNNACFSKAYGGPSTAIQTARPAPSQAKDAKDAQAATPDSAAPQAAVPPSVVPPVGSEQAGTEQAAEQPRRKAKPTKTAKPAAKVAQ